MQFVRLMLLMWALPFAGAHADPWSFNEKTGLCALRQTVMEEEKVTPLATVYIVAINSDYQKLIADAEYSYFSDRPRVVVENLKFEPEKGVNATIGSDSLHEVIYYTPSDKLKKGGQIYLSSLWGAQDVVEAMKREEPLTLHFNDSEFHPRSGSILPAAFKKQYARFSACMGGLFNK